MNEFPGFWRFVWLFFMQPVTLHRLLKSCDVDPRSSGFDFWRRRHCLASAERWWLGSVTKLLCFAVPLVAFVIGLLFLTPGHQLSITSLAVAMAVAMAALVAVAAAIGVFLDLSFCVSLGVAVGVFFGVLLSAFLGVFFALAVGAALGTALDVIVGAAGCVADGAPSRPSFAILLFGVALVVVLSVVMLSGEFPAGTVGLPFVLAYFVTCVRAPFFLVEAVFAVVAKLTGRLDLCPVVLHDLSYFPHPFLRRTILENADRSPELARQVLDACAIAPGQRRAGRIAEAELQARDVSRLIRTRKLTDLADLKGPWLPGKIGAPRIMRGIAASAQYFAAAKAANNPHRRADHLEKLSRAVDELQALLRQKPDAVSRAFEAPIKELEVIAAEELAQAKSQAARVVFNPFRAGDPLSPDEGPELFVGREQAICDIEDLLTDSSRSASLALVAPRRCGKTSLLKMLPAKLPDTVCVFFDLQDNPVSSARAFVDRLAERAIIAARKDARLELPSLPETGSPVESLSRWLDKIEETAGRHRVLFAIDEFERLEDLYPGNRQEFLQIMGLIRATIQHKRRVRFLVSGAATFDELSSVWDDHFINTHQVRLGFLDAAVTEKLLCSPTPVFPADLIPREVAATIYRRTGGQPFLVQMYGSKLVGHVTHGLERRTAEPDDVAAIEPRVFEAADTFFRNSFNSAPEDLKPVLVRLSQGEALPSEAGARIERWLHRRNLLDGSKRLSIPALGTWIEQYAEYPSSTAAHGAS